MLSVPLCDKPPKSGGLKPKQSFILLTDTWSVSAQAGFPLLGSLWGCLQGRRPGDSHSSGVGRFTGLGLLSVPFTWSLHRVASGKQDSHGGAWLPGRCPVRLLVAECGLSGMPPCRPHLSLVCGALVKGRGHGSPSFPGTSENLQTYFKTSAWLFLCSLFKLDQSGLESSSSFCCAA